MKTKEQRRAEYIAKRNEEKKRRAFEDAWFNYKMSICYNDDYYVCHGQYEFIMYQNRYTDKKFHVDFVNGMRFMATTQEECDALIKLYA